jgi:hypothetical protein
MRKLRRYRSSPGTSVPEELLFAGFKWETLREQYFQNLNRAEEALECRQLRAIYSKRLWTECGISVDL